MMSTKQYLAILMLSIVGSAYTLSNDLAFPSFLMGWIFGEVLLRLAFKVAYENL